MSCMGRCVKHGCAFSARLIDGTRDEYCPECEIDHLRTALATAQAEREADIVAALGLVAVAFTAQEGWLCVAKQRAELVANEATALAKDLNAAFGSSAIDAQEFPRIVRELKQRAEQAEADMARLNLERLTVMERALKAEAALAQAQAERDSLIKRLDFWIECNNSERANGRMPTFLNPYTILLWIGDKRAAAEADAAQSPALPPLPEGWVREGVRDIILYRSHDRYTGVDGHVPPGGQVSVHAEGLRVSTTHVPVADLLIVLRHAEAAHLKLKGGAK